MLRREEITSLQVPDLMEEIGGDGSLLVRRSKTDREGEGEIVWIGRDSLRLLRAWLDRGEIGDGPLFRSVGKGGRSGGALPPGQVSRIFKAMARAGRSARGGGRGPVRAQHAGRRGPGHGGRRHRDAGDPPGRAVEVPGNGQPLRRTAAGDAQRRGPACAPAGSGLSGETVCYDLRPTWRPAGRSRMMRAGKTAIRVSHAERIRLAAIQLSCAIIRDAGGAGV